VVAENDFGCVLLVRYPVFLFWYFRLVTAVRSPDQDWSLYRSSVPVLLLGYSYLTVVLEAATVAGRLLEEESEYCSL
jgi:hypothetical protein